MSVYHQMGHHSKNLLFEPHLKAYSGAILSPVNYIKIETIEQVIEIKEKLSSFEVIFDPQLYCPTTERPKLRQWDYFPQDVETADTSSWEWWEKLANKILVSCQSFNPDRLCSPAIVPHQYTNEYYELAVRVADYCQEKATCNVSLTAIVGLKELTNTDRTLQIATILSRVSTNSIYLVFVSELEPRRELDEVEELKGAMRLIRALSQAGMSVLVSFCGPEVILWRFAGAAHFATGKFFNLRRFTVKRFEEPKGAGGGQLPYWFEENLMGLLRESDLLRVWKEGLLSEASTHNPFSASIFEMLAKNPPEAWLAFAWRHYLYWFADFDLRWQAHEIDPKAILKEAEKNWLTLDDKDILMEEARNDGHWVRTWRRSIIEAFAD